MAIFNSYVKLPEGNCFNHVEKYEFVNGKDDNPLFWHGK